MIVIAKNEDSKITVSQVFDGNYKISVYMPEQEFKYSKKDVTKLYGDTFFLDMMGLSYPISVVAAADYLQIGTYNVLSSEQETSVYEGMIAAHKESAESPFERLYNLAQDLRKDISDNKIRNILIDMLKTL